MELPREIFLCYRTWGKKKKDKIKYIDKKSKLEIWLCKVLVMLRGTLCTSNFWPIAHKIQSFVVIQSEGSVLCEVIPIILIQTHSVRSFVCPRVRGSRRIWAPQREDGWLFISWGMTFKTTYRKNRHEIITGYNNRPFLMFFCKVIFNRIIHGF